MKPQTRPSAAYGKMAEVSSGKDTTTGHWELMGIHLHRPFPVYPDGFPDEVMAQYEAETGRGWLGNVPASGTVILDELGAEQMATGKTIVYTSADSVFQIAAHEEVIPLDELYEICETARAILRGEHEVSRVIARPFVGTPGAFTRTANRRDFSVLPPEATLLDTLKEAGQMVYAVGKIEDIFAGQGITDAVHTANDMDGVDQTLRVMGERQEKGLIFTNLVDFDAKYGHRNNPQGYADALVDFDRRVPELMAALNPRRRPGHHRGPRQRPHLRRHRSHPRVCAAAGDRGVDPSRRQRRRSTDVRRSGRDHRRPARRRSAQPG